MCGIDKISSKTFFKDFRESKNKSSYSIVGPLKKSEWKETFRPTQKCEKKMRGVCSGVRIFLEKLPFTIFIVIQKYITNIPSILGEDDENENNCSDFYQMMTIWGYSRY